MKNAAGSQAPKLDLRRDESLAWIDDHDACLRCGLQSSLKLRFLLRQICGFAPLHSRKPNRGLRQAGKVEQAAQKR